MAISSVLPCQFDSMMSAGKRPHHPDFAELRAALSGAAKVPCGVHALIYVSSMGAAVPQPAVYKAGDAFMEPANKRNRAVNKSATNKVTVIIFQLRVPFTLVSMAATH
jgi:hypothetical protein